MQVDSPLRQRIHAYVTMERLRALQWAHEVAQRCLKAVYTRVHMSMGIF